MQLSKDFISDNILLLDQQGTCMDLLIKERDQFVSENIIGKNIFQIFPGEISRVLQEQFLSVARGEKKMNEETMELGADGDIASMHLFRYYFEKTGDAEISVVFHYKDITRSLGKTFVKINNNVQQSIMDLLRVAGIGVWSYDTVLGNLKYIGFADTVYSQDEYQNVDIPEYLGLMSEEDARKVVGYVGAMHTGVYQESVEYKIHGNEQDFYIDNRVVDCIPRGEGYLARGYAQNITSRVLLERELMKAKEAAESSDRLKSAFLANMSHEIRTPLNAIVGFSALILEAGDREMQKEYYRLVELNNKKLLRLIEELLDFSEIQTGAYQFSCTPFDLQLVCLSLQAEYQTLCPREITLETALPALPVEINTDEGASRLVFSCLLSNALKYTRQGQIRFGYSLCSDQVTCFVKDSGIGIAKDKQDYIFEPFAKVDSFVEGMGIGLSLCQMIVEKLGGKMWVSSRVGEGSTFFFTLLREGKGCVER